MNNKLTSFSLVISFVVGQHICAGDALIDTRANEQYEFFSQGFKKAISSGNVDLVKHLLLEGADPDIRFFDPVKPFQVERQFSIRNFLLESPTLENATPLIMAAYKNVPAISAMLIEVGANINACGHSGVSPLIAAISNQDMQTFKLLIAAGADIKHKTIHGVTPLMAAVLYGNDEMVQALLARGASMSDFYIQDTSGASVIELASKEIKKNIKNYRRSMALFPRCRL